MAAASVPDAPLFSVIPKELPVDENSSPVMTSSITTDFGSIRNENETKRSRRARKVVSSKSRLYSETNVGQIEPCIGGEANYGQKCRHSRHSRRKLIEEIQRLSRENQQLLNTGIRESMSQVRVLEHQLEDSHSERAQLRAERDNAIKRVNENEETISKLKNRIKELTQDVYMLKSLVIRLNVELGNTQEKLHKAKKIESSGGTISEDSGLVEATATQTSDASLKSSPKYTWTRAEMNAVAPLLEAYQENLKEKDELINNYKRNLEHFTRQCKEIIAENESLHEQLVEANKKGDITFCEWKSLQREAAMTREQNELLLRQSKLNQSKLSEINNAYQQRITELMLNLDQAEEKVQQNKTELFVLKGRLSILTDENERLKSEVENKIPVAVHNASVNECKRLFEELKKRYEVEREMLIRRLATLESAKPDMDIQLVNLTAERDQLSTENKTMEKLIKQLESKLETNEAKLIKSEKSRVTLKHQVQTAMSFSRELITEQESLLRQLAERTQETTAVTKIGNNIASRMDILRKKLKGVEKGAKIQLDTLEQRIKAQESGMDRVKSGWIKEVSKLKTAIKEKDAIIERLKQDKSKTKEELELVWQAAVADDKRVKESARIVELLGHDDG